ncbi:aminoacyl-tRNA hydrolase [Azospirillum rugosum]|uniref:Peptidyl-tRNA hydrolase n=1 Tax=Azospirillum rugosum TaxID=416170 RepID=A0ABS4SQS9_9PROT|nr:aminoacyl-tRNA hydrolase [Azospirillum rugosum]MBP2294898.1 PTH1 family peptidyl-tRNA hydrolase [Azospirillum rugosum]MDQ0528180.1 PTH1 family peptidyl-tRNA hydrolase [Azospirillum rugosum]
MLLLVGLGNPGAEYARNRHNIGFMAVEEIARRHGFSPWRKRFQGQTADGTVAGDKILALEPLTFMNVSGQSVVAALQFFKLKPENVVVIHDELDLPPGKIRVKKGGGHGGHNGLRSIDSHIGKDYWRIRLGIGHPGNKDLVSGYVLHDFAKADQTWLDPLIDAVADNFPLVVKGEAEKFMSKVALATGPGK